MAIDQIRPVRLFLECTRTRNSPLHTGIERVVRSITATSREVGLLFDVSCQPIAFRPFHGFVPVSEVDLRPKPQNLTMKVATGMKRHLENLGVIGLARNCRQRLLSLSAPTQSVFRRFSREKVKFRPGDLLLLLDSSWTTPYWNEIRRAQRSGAIVGGMIYDLLPLQFPSLVTPRQRDAFLNWWSQAYHRIDFLAAISQTVLGHARDYQRHNPTRTRPLPGGSFRLGADFLTDSTSLDLRNASRDEVAIRTPFGADNFFLCVGTFSKRKQQEFVLDAFESLWNLQRDVKLVYIGGSGWQSESFIRRLQLHSRWGKSLFWFADINDVELSWHYRHASGLITASLGEGFNLPIIEALHHGCPVFASDIAIHREVGREYPKYFPVNDVGRLANLIDAHRNVGRIGDPAALCQFSWPNWKQSCEELLQLILRLANEGHMERRFTESQSA